MVGKRILGSDDKKDKNDKGKNDDNGNDKKSKDSSSKNENQASGKYENKFFPREKKDQKFEDREEPDRVDDRIKKLPKNKTIKHDNKKDDAKDKSNKQNQQR